MVALCSETYYSRDSEGEENYPARACRRTQKPTPDGDTNHGIITGASGHLYTYQQEWTALSYVCLKRCVVDESVLKEPLHPWATHHYLPACLPPCHPRWCPPSPPMAPPTGMRCMTCSCSGLFTCSSPAVSAVASPHWPHKWWHYPRALWQGRLRTS